MHCVSTLQVMEGTISRLHRAREEEKKLRKSFQSSHGVHFVTSLFPELQDRVPDITVICCLISNLFDLYLPPLLHSFTHQNP